MVFAATLAFAKRRPLTFAIGFGGVKTIAADAFVQKYMEHADAYDQKRLLVFLTFGFFQVGFVQYNVYVNLFSRLFPAGASFTAAPIAAKLADGQGLRNLAKQVFIDQCVYHPCCYFPVFYICKEIINAEPQPPLTTVRRCLRPPVAPPPAASGSRSLWPLPPLASAAATAARAPARQVRNALTAYAPNATEDLKALWSIFVPVSIVQMSFVPMHLRVPFNASVGFIWCMILVRCPRAPVAVCLPGSSSRGHAVQP
jgi:hypothetical protein